MEPPRNHRFYRIETTRQPPNRYRLPQGLPYVREFPMAQGDLNPTSYANPNEYAKIQKLEEERLRYFAANDREFAAAAAQGKLQF